MKKNIKNSKKNTLVFKSGMQDKTPVKVTKALSEVELSNKPLLIISKEVQNQILYFHTRTGKKEWSGFLLFDQQGDLNDIDKMVLTAKHIHLLDIGSETFTSITDYDPFEITDDIGEIALEYKMGIIHTHHNMNTFFSGTDKGCLHENAENYPFLLSLIVNFEGDYKAKIAFTGTEGSTQRELTLNSRLNNLVLDLGKAADKEVLITCDCTIQLEQEDYTIKRYNALVKKKQEAEAKKINTSTDFWKSPAWDNMTSNTQKYYHDDWYDSHNHLTRNNTQTSLFTEETPLNKDSKIDMSITSLDQLMAKVINVDPNHKVSDTSTLYYILRKGNDQYNKLANSSEQELYIDYLDSNFEEICNAHFKQVLGMNLLSKVAHACAVRIKTFKDIPFVEQLLEVIETYDLEFDVW